MSVWINDDDLSALGWRIAASSGLDDLPALSLPTLPLPIRGVSLAASTYRQAAPRDFSLVFSIRTTALATLETALNVLKEKLLSGTTVDVRHALRTGQKLVARCTGGALGYGIGPQYVAPYSYSVELRFTADDPFWQDTTPQSIAVTTSATLLPMGTAPTRAKVTLSASGGSVVNPKFRYLTNGSTQLWETGFTHTILTGDAVELDAETGQVRKRVSGVWSDAENLLTAGFTLPVFHPKDGTYSTAAWPRGQIAADSGSGFLSCTAAYPRRWG